MKTFKQSTINYLNSIGINTRFIEMYELISTNFIGSTKPKILNEPILLFSDIHGNFPALKLTIDFSKQNNINNFISLGDLIEYNNHGNEVLELIQAEKNKFISLIKGNHDQGKVRDNDKFITSYFSEEIDIKHANFILNMPTLDLIQIQNKKILLCHSNPWTNDMIYLFPTYYDLLDYFLEFLHCDGFFFGHTHHLTFYTNENNKLLFNPGSLGVSRDGNPRLTFSWVYPDTGAIEIYEISHSIDEFTLIENSEPRLVQTYQIPL